MSQVFTENQVTYRVRLRFVFDVDMSGMGVELKTVHKVLDGLEYLISMHYFSAAESSMGPGEPIYSNLNTGERYAPIWVDRIKLESPLEVIVHLAFGVGGASAALALTAKNIRATIEDFFELRARINHHSVLEQENQLRTLAMAHLVERLKPTTDTLGKRERLEKAELAMTLLKDFKELDSH